MNIKYEDEPAPMKFADLVVGDVFSPEEGGSVRIKMRGFAGSNAVLLFMGVAVVVEDDEPVTYYPDATLHIGAGK